VNLLLVLYGLTISKAEVAGILQAKHMTWLPAYNQLAADIRAAPVVHADETPWKIQQEGGGYAWVLADASSTSVCYDLATSRGAPHAQSLFGQGTDHPFAGIRITDDYGAYRNPELPGTQQLCRYLPGSKAVSRAAVRLRRTGNTKQRALAASACTRCTTNPTDW
jgi:hypothetical protein